MVGYDEVKKRQMYISISKTPQENILESHCILNRLNTRKKFDDKPLVNNSQYYNDEELTKGLFEYALENNLDSTVLENALLHSSKKIIKENKKLIQSVANKYGYDSISKQLYNIISAERIINNQKKLNEMFNIDKYGWKCRGRDMITIDGVVTELCDIINDIDIPYNLKANIALENINYTLQNNNVKYNENIINRNILEYFSLVDDNNMDSLYSIMEYLKLEKSLLNEGKKFDKASQKFSQFIQDTKTKSKESIKKFITKLYSDSPQNIIEDLPSILRIIRKFLVFSTMGINLPIGAILSLVDCLIEHHIKIKEVEKAIKEFQKEKERIDQKKHSVSNEKTKEKYENLSKELQQGLDKLYEYKSKLKDDDDDFEDDDDDDFSFDENGNLVDVADFIYQLESVMSVVSEDDNLISVMESTSIEESRFLRRTKGVIKNIGGKANSKVKMAAIKAKETIKSLPEKDRMLSKKMDDAYDRFRDKIEKGNVNKNREAVIKGSIIPSFSGLMKLIATTTAIGALIDPALAAITALCAIARSKHATNKERRLILDEIEIQLKMVEKKMSLAESNNDMKALEDLMRIQSKLKNERQRIIYKGRAKNIQVINSGR